MATAVKRSMQYDCEIDVKRFKIEPNSLLDFSDCVLLKILSFLKPYDLYSLSKTCMRFKYLICERKLWRNVNVLDHPMCARKFKFFFNNVNVSTESILVSGISKKEKTLTFSQFIKMHNMCDNITILAIENQYINSDEIGLQNFPYTLKELSLRGTHIYGRKPFLHDAHLKLDKLHTLILADCKWFHEHSLMALSKLNSLENLSLYKCANLNDSVAYMSITAKFGFRKLLRIDARYTAIGDQFLKCFHCIKTLREIYLEAPVRNARRRCRAPRCAVLDQLQRLAGPPGPSAVVFNRTQLFKMRRDRKSPKKHKKPTIAPPAALDPSSNCLENSLNCSIDTCTVIPSTQPTDASSPPSSQEPEEPNSSIFTIVPLSALERAPNTMRFMNPLGQISCAPELACLRVASGSGQGPSSYKEANEANEEEQLSPRCNSPDEMLYCDDVSDTDDDGEVEDGTERRRARSVSEALLELEMLQADVSDSGLLWFVGATPADSDYAGEPTSLFRPPYRQHCTCSNTTPNNNNQDGDDGAGPSGFKPNQPPSPQNDPDPHEIAHQNATQRVARLISHINNASASTSSSSDSDLSDSEPSVAVAAGSFADRPGGPDRPGGASGASGISVPRGRVGLITPPARRDNNIEEVYQVIGRREGRDLRVIIERLDPGVHIVYENGGHRRRPDLHNSATQLKVFVARGYKLITNQALRSLVDLRLELLDVTGTSVSAAGIKDFLLVNPDCRVIHETTCQCGYQP